MMMGSSKHLNQFLNEDQEPFILKSYINEKRSQLNKPVLRTQIKLNRQQSPISCKNVCFFSFHDTPNNPTKSPLFDFSKSPCRNSNTNTLFVHIPAKTAALLLEAALRIQKQSEKPKNIGFGLFGSILKRIRRRKKSEIKRCGGENEIQVSVKDVVRVEIIDLELEEKRVSDVGLSCSCNNSRVSSTSTWTESNDLETSTSSRSCDCYEETEQQESNKIDEFHLCQNGDSFRFICHRLPELVSPATSPNRPKNQVAKNEKEHLNPNGHEQKEEKEHCSPVSVLDLQIEDDVEEQDKDEHEDKDEDDSQLERSFVSVQKTKLRLLQKLRRFERLAELDPLELEKRISEDEDEDGDDEDDKSGDGSILQDNEHSNLFTGEVLRGSNCSDHRRIPSDMKKLIIDLMSEEGAVAESNKGANKCCMRLGSLKDVERINIHTMIQTDFNERRTEWQKNNDHVEDIVVAVELAIFGFLVEELSVELVHSNDH